MSAITAIEWAERTWNPVRGCSVISPGCHNCYAIKFAHRFSGAGKPYAGWTGTVRTVDDALREPLGWRRPARVFVNSMSDLFHGSVPRHFIDQVFMVMTLAAQHTFLVLTKRPERMRAFLDDEHALRRRLLTLVRGEAEKNTKLGERLRRYGWPEFSEAGDWPLPNLWLGVSVENQETADERIPLLLDTPAAIRFVSYEPALGPVDFVMGGQVTELGHVDWLRGVDGCEPQIPGLDWVIVGGESGPGARPCAVEWLESAVAQCRAAQVPVFVKQLGAYVVSEQRACVDAAELLEMRGPESRWPEDRWLWRAGLDDPKGGEPREWPQYLQVREFPTCAR